jgi:hypothetical protein
MISRIFCVFCLASSLTLADDRLKVSDNTASTDLNDALSAAANAFDSEDLDAYERCFSESRRKSMRRKAAMLFVAGECSMELVESHTVDVGEDLAEAVVRYKIGNSQVSSECVSTVRMVREDGRWVIESESPISKKHKSLAEPSSIASARGGNAEWDHLNPEKAKIPATLHHLMGDIGIQEGMGCHNGRCGVRRCENGRCPQ